MDPNKINVKLIAGYLILRSSDSYLRSSDSYASTRELHIAIRIIVDEMSASELIIAQRLFGMLNA